MTFNVGDMVSYGTVHNNAVNAKGERVYGIVVGFTHNDYYFIDWFDGHGHGNTWGVPYHVSMLSPVGARA